MLSGMRDAIVFPLFSVFVWTGENNSNTLSVDAYIFENGGKNLRFRNIWIRAEGAVD